MRNILIEFIGPDVTHRWNPIPPFEHPVMRTTFADDILRTKE